MPSVPSVTQEWRVTIARLHRKVLPLQGSDSSPDDHLADFPLRDSDARSPGPPEWVQPPLVAHAEPAVIAAPDDRPLFASSTDEPRRRGMRMWLAAAASLVLGIVIGFASGYRAGQGQAPDIVAAPEGTPSTPTSGASTPGQSFSESTVEGPVRLEETPIVPAPDSPQPAAGSAPGDAGSAPIAPERRGTRPTPAAEPAAVGRVPPETVRSGGGPASPPTATSPGSLQVLSRPAGAQVILDGQVVGKTPLTIPNVSAGPHDVRLELPGFNRWATTVDVPAGKPARVAASLEQ